MSDSEAEYAIESEDEIAQDDVFEDEYEAAIERYADLIREVPQAKLDGIVEQIEELFVQPDINQQIINDERQNDAFAYALILALFITLTSILIRTFLNEKRMFLLENNE